MEKVFIDTSAFYAIATPADSFYKPAKDYLELINDELDTYETILITTDYIVCETLNLLNMRQGNKKAIQFLESMENSPHFNIENLLNSLKEEAKKIFKKNQDEDYSFTDCTSFAFMKEKGIKKAFAFDDHFKQYGFELIK